MVLGISRIVASVAVGLLLAQGLPVGGAASGSVVGLGMDASSLGALSAAGAPADYASYWVGEWITRSGWAGVDNALKQAKAAGATPVLYWYYWGDSISPSCVENGCSDKTKAEWDAMTTTLAQKLRDSMGGAPVYVVLENEFNKGGITDSWYAPTFDAYLEAKANELKAVPGVKIILGYGAWGEDAWGRFPKAIAASDMIGFQLMRASTKDSEASYRGSDDKIASVLAKVKSLWPGKQAFLYDVALSSYPDSTYRTIQAETLQSIMDRRAEYAANGLVGLVYRELRDNPSMGTHNYFGIAEQYWGFRDTNNNAKPAYAVWMNGGASQPPAPAPAPAPSPSIPASFEAEAMAPTTGGREADASASGGAVWNVWTNGEVAQRVASPGGTYRVTIVARGSSAAGIDAQMELRLDGAKVSGWTVPSGTLRAFTADVAIPAGNRTLAVAFTNDALVNGQDRNLFVDVLRVETPPAPNQPPVAAFAHAASGLRATLDASGSSDPEGAALSYAWDFGDGASGAGVLATHDYAASGTYTVKLTVSDGQSASSATAALRVEKPNAAPSASFAVSGADLSWSLDAAASSDPDGDALAYAWTFGDGATASGPTASHAYAAPGTYTITLTVTDARGASATATRAVSATQPNRAPVASFAATGTGLAWGFDASASNDADGDALTYAWTLGDGASASGATVAHAYAPGTYVVTLTVSDGKLAATQQRTITVVQPNRAPTASFVATGGDLTWTLDASASSDADGDRMTFLWDLGDGRTATGMVVSVTYAAQGDKLVRLTVSDGNASAEATRTIAARAPAPPAPAPAHRARQAEDFVAKDNGARFSDASAQNGSAWLLWSNGAVSQPFAPGAGTYRVEVVAKGDAAGKVWPAMELRADGVRLASWSVSSSTWKTYSAVTTFSASQARNLSVAFTNDAVVSGQDRNLRIDAVRLVAGASVEGESFASKANGASFSDAAASAGAAWLLWSNGAMTHTVRSEGGAYVVEVVAKGDYAAGWPAMEVRIDGTLVARFDVASSTWQAYRATTTISAGEHTVSVSFTNDYRTSSADRNLRVDLVSLTPT